MGKGLDNSFPVGPWLVTPDEVGDLSDLDLTLKVNGKTKQSASTSDMIFGIDEMVSYLSRGITLRPGDLISAGTPQWVAYFSNSPFLTNGDILESSIAGWALCEIRSRPRAKAIANEPGLSSGSKLFRYVKRVMAGSHTSVRLQQQPELGLPADSRGLPYGVMSFDL
jgi:hypothetical protein